MPRYLSDEMLAHNGAASLEILGNPNDEKTPIKINIDGEDVMTLNLEEARKFVAEMCSVSCSLTRRGQHET